MQAAVAHERGIDSHFSKVTNNTSGSTGLPIWSFMSASRQTWRFSSKAFASRKWVPALRRDTEMQRQIGRLISQYRPVGVVRFQCKCRERKYWQSSLLQRLVIGIYELVSAAAEQRVGLVFGKTWAVCSALIAMLSVPVFVSIQWTMRQLAPNQLRLAGATAGMCSGATGSFVYCLHCPETDLAFIGVWYLLGILIPTLIGALIGRSILRW